MGNKKVFILAAVAVFLIATGASYFLFSQNNHPTIVTTPPVKTSNGLAFDNSLPKTQPCPLNGALYSTQQESWWQKHSPLGVMIENSTDARPQSGLSSADVVYEAVAEGGITRFLSIFYCQDAPFVGPVRSARTYFIDFLSEYGKYPLYGHVGGANAEGEADALGQLEQYGWAGYNDLNQFSIGFPTFWRDYSRQGRTVATEHTMYSSTSKLWDFAAKDRNITNINKGGDWSSENFVPYAFKDDAASSQRPASQIIQLTFWAGSAFSDYAVKWTYDAVTNTYNRSDASGKPYIDINTKKQLAAKNVIILSMVESHANDGYANNEHLLYDDKGTGKATIFMDGKQVLGKWKKDSRTGRTLIFDANGAPIKFNRGQLWFSVLPQGTGVLTVQ